MRFVAEQGFDLRSGKAHDFQEWLSANEEKIKAECPQGVEYEGTYAVVQTSEKGTGNYRTLWRMDSYGAQDHFAAAMKGGTAFHRLVEEMSAFSDNDNHANWSFTILKAATEASIWGD